MRNTVAALGALGAARNCRERERVMKKTTFGILVVAVAGCVLGALPGGRMNRNAPLTGAHRRVKPVRVEPVETNRIERSFSLETNAVKNDVKTVSGKFHAGMTRKEAEEASLDSCLFSRDFNDIDRNGDGVLSVRELCEERKLETDKGVRKADLMGRIATPVFCIGTTLVVCAALFSTIKGFCVAAIGLLLAFVGGGVKVHSRALRNQFMIHGCETKEIIIRQYAAEGAGTIRHGTLEVKGVFAPGGEDAVGMLTWEPATTFSGTMRLNVGDRIVCESAFNLVDVTIEVLDRENLKNAPSWTVVSSAGRRITGHVKGHNLEGTGYTVHVTPGAVEIVKCGE